MHPTPTHFKKQPHKKTNNIKHPFLSFRARLSLDAIVLRTLRNNCSLKIATLLPLLAMTKMCLRGPRKRKLLWGKEKQAIKIVVFAKKQQS
jgi:hypothetical protein